MLMYGSSSAVRNLIFSGYGVVYNLTSMAEGFYTLPNLIPPNSLPRSTERDFDMQYAEYIFNNETVFVEFFSVIYNLYLGLDVFIVIDEDANWAENILESLLKLIQQRYGYNAVYISTDDDYVYAKNNAVSKFAPGFGIYNLDQDKERFTYLVEQMKQKVGSIPPGILWGE